MVVRISGSALINIKVIRDDNAHRRACCGIAARCATLKHARHACNLLVVCRPARKQRRADLGSSGV